MKETGREREWEEEGFSAGSYVADILLPDDKVKEVKEEARKKKERSLETGVAGGFWEAASSSSSSSITG